MSRSRSVVLTLILCAAAAPTGCATTGVRGNLSYADRARAAYEAGMEHFRSSSWVDAEDQFKRVRREFGLSRWAWLAELRLADIEFKKENYAQAVQQYRSWLRYHPTQPEAVYAQFMIAKSYFAQIPSDWALVPASWQRDQSSTHDAEDALRRFVAEYADSRYAPEARDLLRRARELLARAEIHVGEYYLSRERPQAAIARFAGVLRSYRGSGLEPEALVKIGETYLQMGRKPEAHAAFTVLVTRYPRSSYAQTAQRYLRFIGPLPPRRTPPPPDEPVTPAPEGAGG